MYTQTKTNGYSLVEVLVAIAILLLALVGPMTIAAKGIQSASYVSEQTVAIFLAQEGLEAFTAARNDATIAAFAIPDLSQSWDWASDGTIDASCFTANGCNLEYTNTTPMNTIVGCGVGGAGCELYFDDTNPNDRARYSLDSGNTATSYTRVIKVTSIQGGKGLQVESTVYWNTRLFSSQEQSVTLTSSLFSIYE